MTNSEKKKKEKEINDKRISTRDNSSILTCNLLQPVRLINRLSIKARESVKNQLKKKRKKNWERVIAPEVSRNSNLSYQGA